MKRYHIDSASTFKLVHECSGVWVFVSLRSILESMAKRLKSGTRVLTLAAAGKAQ